MTKPSSPSEPSAARTLIPYCFLCVAAFAWLWILMSSSLTSPRVSFGAQLVVWTMCVVSPFVALALTIAYYPARSVSLAHRWAFRGCVLYSSVGILVFVVLIVLPSLHRS